MLFLSLADSDKDAPNENFARELMELFTLGKGYSEHDIREAARALTGFRSKWTNDGFQGIHYDPERHDGGVKHIFGKRGRFDWHDVMRLVVAHPAHAPFLVNKLWLYFVTDPPSRATTRALGAIYRRSGHRIKPVVAAILAHPALYRKLDAPDMVKSPVVYVAGSLRTTGLPLTLGSPTWMLSTAWASARSTRRRSRAGSGAPPGCRRTPCACASTGATSCSRTSCSASRRAPSSPPRAGRRARAGAQRHRAPVDLRRDALAPARPGHPLLRRHQAQEPPAPGRGPRRDAPAGAAPAPARRPRRPTALESHAQISPPRLRRLPPDP